MKNTIQYILAYSSLLFIVNGWAQNTNLDFKNAIKIYNLSSYELNIKTEPIINSPSGAYYFTTVNSQFLHPTIAFQWKSKKNNFHEIELTDFSLNKMSAKIQIIQIGNVNQDTLNLQQHLFPRGMNTFLISTKQRTENLFLQSALVLIFITSATIIRQYFPQHTHLLIAI